MPLLSATHPASPAKPCVPSSAPLLLPWMPPGPLPAFSLPSSGYPDVSPNLSQKCGCPLDTLPKPLRETPGRPLLALALAPPASSRISAMLVLLSTLCPLSHKGLCSLSPAPAPHLFRATPLAWSLKAPMLQSFRTLKAVVTS